MAKLVKWIDEKGNIKISEYANDNDPIIESNVIEISELKPSWKIEKPVYKVTYDYDEYASNPVTEFYSTNDVIVAIDDNAKFKYNIGNYKLKDLIGDYGFCSDDYNPMRLIKKLNRTGYANFISVYDHGDHEYYIGHSGDEWDISFIGIIYVPYTSTKNGELFARGLLDEVTNWANGDCYQVMIDELVNGEWDTISGCCGYYSKEHCINTTKTEIEGITKNDTDPLIITIDNTY